jgi:hypothetical protein
LNSSRSGSNNQPVNILFTALYRALAKQALSGKFFMTGIPGLPAFI